VTLVIDAGIWVAAADASDALAGPSRAFLAAVARRRLPVSLPAIARLEVACALARRLRDAARGRALADALVRGPMVRERALDPALLARALDEGTAGFLRGADEEGELVSWDAELGERAAARTPESWLSAYP
jgi:predicted nucleic acid-binding protein